ncbi:MAG: ABC transporter permease [Acidimicrobiia bacterium]
MSNFQAIWLIARREAKERARSKAFLASTAVTVLLLGAVVTIVALTDSGPPRFDVALVGDSPTGLTETLNAAAIASNALINYSDLEDREAIADAIELGDLDAAVLDDDTILLGPNPSTTLQTILEIGLRQSRLIERLEDAGLEPDALTSIFGADGGVSIITAGDPDEGAGEGIAFATIVLLFLVITTYGQWVLMGVLEEKSTRVVELVVSSTSVRNLLAGKVLGIGMLGLAQLVALVAIALTAGSVFDLFEIPGGSISTAAWSLVWFVLGFAFYAALNAAAGSLVSRTEDAQAAAMPIALVAVASYLVTFAVIMPNPDSTTAVLISFLPPVAPIAFPARIGFVGVPLWQILAGVVVMIVAVVAVVRLAARVYAGALLASGGRVKIRDAWRAAAELTAGR